MIKTSNLLIAGFALFLVFLYNICLAQDSGLTDPVTNSDSTQETSVSSQNDRAVQDNDPSTQVRTNRAVISSAVSPRKLARQPKMVPYKSKGPTGNNAHFVFADNVSLSASPRKPLFITLVIESKTGAKSASVKYYAEEYSSKNSIEIFHLSRLLINEGRGQTQFYWAAKKSRTEYVPKGRYYIRAVVSFYGAGGSLLGTMSSYPEPMDNYLVTVR